MIILKAHCFENSKLLINLVIIVHITVDELGTLQTGFMEKTSRNQRPQSQHWKDQNFDLQLKPAFTQRFRNTPLCGVCVIKGLVVSNSIFCGNVNLRYTRNVVLKVTWKLMYRCKRCSYGGLCKPADGMVNLKSIAIANFGRHS